MAPRLHSFLLVIAQLVGLLVIPGSKGFVSVPRGPFGSVSVGPTRRCRALPGRVRSPAMCEGRLEAAAGNRLTPSSGGGGGGGGGATYTCRNCKQQFRRDNNADDACSFHPGLFSGRLNRVNDVDTSGLEYFWSCCGEPDRAHPGCATGRHASYDDPPEGGERGWRSPLTGTLRSSG